jgi:hypothetical protein
MNKMNTIEKIAMVWTLPAMIILAIIGFIAASIIYLIRAIFVFTGTAGASIHIVKTIRKKFQSWQWNAIMERDAMIAEIDQMTKQ